MVNGRPTSLFCANQTFDLYTALSHASEEMAFRLEEDPHNPHYRDLKERGSEEIYFEGDLRLQLIQVVRRVFSDLDRLWREQCDKTDEIEGIYGLEKEADARKERKSAEDATAWLQMMKMELKDAELRGGEDEFWMGVVDASVYTAGGASGSG